MSFSVVFSSLTGNTKLLAEGVKEALCNEECVYFGAPSDEALATDRIYVGFWTDKGSCDEKTKEFLAKVSNKEVFLFGTAGFGGSSDYYDKVMGRVISLLSADVKLVGSFMCQGKMPMVVRKRFEMLEDPEARERRISNFDKALSHPDSDDLANLKSVVISCR